LRARTHERAWARRERRWEALYGAAPQQRRQRRNNHPRRAPLTKIAHNHNARRGGIERPHFAATPARSTKHALSDSDVPATTTATDVTTKPGAGDRNFVRQVLYKYRTHFKQEQSPHHVTKGQKPPSLNWSVSRKEKNRVAHAINGNTAAAGACAPLTDAQLATARENKRKARVYKTERARARHEGLFIPHAREGADCRLFLMEPPDDWLTWVPPQVEATLLRDHHPHARDQRLRFHADTHTYYVDNLPTMGSVTGLIHRWCGTFRPDVAIDSMRRSDNWPPLH
jgi:hypothetical protein